MKRTINSHPLFGEETIFTFPLNKEALVRIFINPTPEGRWDVSNPIPSSLILSKTLFPLFLNFSLIFFARACLRILLNCSCTIR